MTVVAFIGKVVYMDKFPPGMSHDELELALSAKTILKNGADASGIKFPQFLIASKLESGATGLVSLILAPIFAFADLNMLNIRIVYLIVGLLTALFTAGVVNNFTNFKIAVITFVVSLFMPWMFIYSRMALAAPFALLFMLVGIFVMLSQNGWKVFYSLPFFAISMFSYYGAMPTIPLVVLVLAIIHATNKTQLKINLLLIISIVLCLFGFILISKHNPESVLSTRSVEVKLLDLDQQSGAVDEIRKQSIDSPINNLFVNKPLLLLEDLTNVYLGAFSINNLFVNGDTRAAYDLGRHGLLYYIDAILIVLGIVALYKFDKKLGLLLGAMALLGPIGSALNKVEHSYVFRSYPLIFVFTVLISLGVWYVYQLLTKRTRNLFILVFGIIYILFFVRFVHFYDFNYSVRQAENHNLTERLLVNYLMRETKEMDVYVSSPRQITNQYAFFAKDYDSLAGIMSGQYVINNHSLKTGCPEIFDEGIVIEEFADCAANEARMLIQDQKDAGYVYGIINGSLCNIDDQDSYKRVSLIADYEIEDLSDADFCNRWIAKSL